MTVKVPVLDAAPFVAETVYVPAMVGVTALLANVPPEAGVMLKVVPGVTLPIELPKTSVATAV